MAAPFVFFLSLLLYGSNLSVEIPAQLVVWNIGQGQFVTFVKDEACYHIDVGGERFPSAQIRRLCGFGRNVIFLSHFDWDHINFLKNLAKVTHDSCVNFSSTGKPSPKKRALINRYAICKTPLPFQVFEPKSAKTSNAQSRVAYGSGFVFPGDSPSAQEKEWVPLIKRENFRIRVLVLGHHGSRTSSHLETLLQLRPQMAVASARAKRYGHPHQEVRQRLKQIGIDAIKTEDWGHLHFWL